MEFVITHHLQSGPAVEVTAEVDIRKEDVNMSFTLPWGSGTWLDRVIEETHLEREIIEEKVWQSALDRHREIADARG